MCVEQNCPVGSAGCRRRGDCPWDRNTGTRKLGRWGIWRPAFACCATTEPPLTERPPPPAPAARRLSLCHGPWSTMSLAPGRVGPFGCPFAGGEDVRLRLALTAGLGFRLAHRERLLVNQIDLPIERLRTPPSHTCPFALLAGRQDGPRRHGRRSDARSEERRVGKEGR